MDISDLESNDNPNQPPNLSATLALIEVRKPIAPLRRNRNPRGIMLQRTCKELINDRFIINLVGEINSSCVSKFTSDCSDAVEADNDSVLILLSSEGGQVWAGMHVYEQIELLAAIKPVDIIVTELCMSTAVWSIMALPRKNRWVVPGGCVMIHPSFITDEGGVPIPRRRLSLSDRERVRYVDQEYIVDTIANGTDIRRNDLRRMVREDSQDVHISAARAVELGIFAGMAT